MVIKMLIELRRRMEEYSKNFNKEKENTGNRSHKTEEYNNWSEKYTVY